MPIPAGYEPFWRSLPNAWNHAASARLRFGKAHCALNWRGAISFVRRFGLFVRLSALAKWLVGRAAMVRSRLTDLPGPFGTTYIIAMQEDEIHRLWDELSDFDLTQSKVAAAHMMTRLVELGGVWNATWAGALRINGGDANDPLQGWRVAAAEALHPVPLQHDGKHLAGVMDAWDRREIDPSFLLPLQGVGRFRTYSLRRDLPADWFETTFYQRHYGFCGIHDLVLIAFPLNEDCESHVGFYSREPISDATIMLLTYALRGIKWFHRHLMLSHGLLVAKAPLTPTEHKILQCLLTEATEKQIANQVGLAASTTHQHVVAIFRKFGVRSRAGLMSLWFNS